MCLVPRASSPTFSFEGGRKEETAKGKLKVGEEGLGMRLYYIAPMLCHGVLNQIQATLSHEPNSNPPMDVD